MTRSMHAPVVAAPEKELVTELRRNSGGLWAGVFQSLSFIGPAGDVAILLVGTALFALGSTPLAVLIAWLLYGIWMIVPREFSKVITNTGSYYAYAARGFKGGGVMALWFWMGENLTGPAFAVLGLSSFIYVLVASFAATSWAWAPIAIAILLFGVILSYLGIKPSLKFTVFFGTIEAAFLFITAVVIIILLASNNTWDPFTLKPLHGNLHPLFLGVIFSVLDFTGLGTATTISEEVKNSKKTINRALWIAWAFAGLALVLPSYALTAGWGVDKMSTYASSPDPGLIVYEHYLGTVGWWFLIIITVTSYMSFMVAKVNAVTRIWFSAGRDRVLLTFLGKVHPRFRTPSRAVISFGIVVLAANIIAGAILGPENGGLWLLTIAGIEIIGVHIVGNTALTIYMWRARRFRWIIHGILPSFATLTGLVVLYYSVIPLPSGATESAVIVGLAWLLVGLLLAAWYARKRSELLALSGMSRDAEADAAGAGEAAASGGTAGPPAPAPATGA